MNVHLIDLVIKNIDHLFCISLIGLMILLLLCLSIF